MNYGQMASQIQELDFIQTRETAEAVCKAVWGIITSSLGEPLAKEVASQLPGELTEEKLRGHQERKLQINLEQFIQEISTQFQLNSDQASTLVQKAIQLGEQALQEETISRLRKSVPQNMAALV